MTSSKSVSVETISRADALRLLPKRDETAHKWGVGGLVIIGGAPGYIGAPALAAMSAGRSGAGIVSLAVPRSSVGVTAALVPEAVFLPLPDTDSSHGVQKAIELIRPHVEKSRALVVGPGLSRDEMATMLLEALFGNAPRTAARSLGFGAQTAKVASEPEDPVIGGDTHAVVDADALHWLAERESWWAQVRPFSLILTPHVGELAALTGADSREILNDPAASASKAARDWQQTVVLKAGKAFVSDGTVVKTVAAASPALATAGSGDVLSGSIGAFLAQGLNPLDAAVLAIYAGTEAGNALADQYSTLGVVATDVPRAIAHVLAELETESAGKS